MCSSIRKKKRKVKQNKFIIYININIYMLYVCTQIHDIYIDDDDMKCAHCY
jgi:hypothetical protein